LEHRAFIKSLSAEQRRELTTKNDASAAIRLLVLIVLFSLNSVLVFSSSTTILLWMLIQGLLLMSLFHLLHECVHETVFKKKSLNRAVAFLCGFLIFLPSQWFQHFHFAHHRFTQIPGKDPELESAKPSTRIDWLIHISGLPVWFSQFNLFVKSVFSAPKDSFIIENDRKAVRIEIIIMLFLYVVLVGLSVFFESAVLVKLWWLPVLLGQPFLRLYLLAEHTGCENESNMFSNTRTVLTNRWFKWFTLMKTHLLEVEKTYITFNYNYFKSF